jgi:hypothetical protein
VDRNLVVVDGDAWVLDLPGGAITTSELGEQPLPIEDVILRFGVSRDEEHIEVTVVEGPRTTVLPARSHHYLLLTLARARLDDQDPSPGERGWVDRALLCRMLATEPNLLNVAVFRARKQFAEHGIHGAAAIIARRPGTGQLRLGTDRVEVTKL